MRKLLYLNLALLMAAGLSLGATKPAAKAKTFVGTISDKMCGAHHMMEGGAKECTLKCVEMGSAFVLVDDKGKVFDLSDQEKPKPFAAQKVQVTGSLDGDTIMVSSIKAVN